MALGRLIVAWMLVTAWLLFWEGTVRRVGRRGSGARLRAPTWTFLIEGLLLTLFAALWFGSLGSGGWGLLFALVGALMVWREFVAAGRPVSWRGGARITAGVLRIVGAGALLAWRLAAS
jgi:TRAP-type C4-dicarboxylate transport system permease large subunit